MIRLVPIQIEAVPEYPEDLRTADGTCTGCLFHDMKCSEIREAIAQTGLPDCLSGEVVYQLAGAPPCL